MLIKLILILLIAFATSQNHPGFKVGLSKRGLDYARDVGMEILNNELKNTNIPDQKSTASSPIGKIELTISNIKLNSVELPNPQISFVPSTGILLQVQDAATSIGFKWKFKQKKFPKLSDSGTGTVSASGVRMAVDIQIIAEAGKLKANIRSTAFSIGHFKLSLKGGASWFYNFFIDIFKDKIKKEIENEVKKEIAKIVNVELNEVLKSLPTNILISDGIGLDYSQSGNPIFTQTYMTLQGNGEFYEWNNRTPSSAPRRVLPDFVNTNYHFELLFSDFVALSAGEAFHKTKKLIVEIDDKMLPPKSPIRLNTTHFAIILPALYEHFPDKLLSLVVKTTQPPKIEISENGLKVVLIGELECWVHFPDGTRKIAFILGTMVTCSGKVWVEGSNLVGELTLLQINNALKHTVIGQFDVGKFDSLINMLFEVGIIPGVNKQLAKGFPLPSSSDVKFVFHCYK
jgi:lipopolysaccharide-binding protein